MPEIGIDQNREVPQRVCRCGIPYTIDQYYKSSPSYFDKPYDYSAGCETYCLACWLGVGPNDVPEDSYTGGRNDALA